MDALYARARVDDLGRDTTSQWVGKVKNSALQEKKKKNGSMDGWSAFEFWMGRGFGLMDGSMDGLIH